MKELFRNFDFNEAPAEMITTVCGMDLPEDYLEFMSEHNGGEGPIGEVGYGCFFRLEELEDCNTEYDVQKSWPVHIVIGSDMGGMLWAYCPEKEVYCQIDSCSISDDAFFDVSESLEEFVRKLG
jgi:hypothetical protein